MIRWCPGCFRFVDEVPPFSNYEIVPVESCRCDGATGGAKGAPARRTIETVREFRTRLFRAARLGRLADTIVVVQEGVRIGIQPLDLLMGLVQPMLYEIGSRWAHGKVGVWEEHRFTAFCEWILDIIVREFPEPRHASAVSGPGCDVLVVSAESSFHILGPKILAYMLRSKGFRSEIFTPSVPPEEIPGLIELFQPQVLAVSIATREQFSSLQALDVLLSTVPISRHPEIWVGGPAVRLGSRGIATVNGREVTYCEDPMRLIEWLGRHKSQAA